MVFDALGTINAMLLQTLESSHGLREKSYELEEKLTIAKVFYLSNTIVLGVVMSMDESEVALSFISGQALITMESSLLEQGFVLSENDDE